jgi:hypothetical protein
MSSQLDMKSSLCPLFAMDYSSLPADLIRLICASFSHIQTIIHIAITNKQWYRIIYNNSIAFKHSILFCKSSGNSLTDSNGLRSYSSLRHLHTLYYHATSGLPLFPIISSCGNALHTLILDKHELSDPCSPEQFQAFMPHLNSLIALQLPNTPRFTCDVYPSLLLLKSLRALQANFSLVSAHDLAKLLQELKELVCFQDSNLVTARQNKLTSALELLPSDSNLALQVANNDSADFYLDLLRCYARNCPNIVSLKLIHYRVMYTVQNYLQQLRTINLGSTFPNLLQLTLFNIRIDNELCRQLTNLKQLRQILIVIDSADSDVNFESGLVEFLLSSKETLKLLRLFGMNFIAKPTIEAIAQCKAVYLLYLDIWNKAALSCEEFCALLYNNTCLACLCSSQIDIKKELPSNSAYMKWLNKIYTNKPLQGNEDILQFFAEQYKAQHLSFEEYHYILSLISCGHNSEEMDHISKTNELYTVYQHYSFLSKLAQPVTKIHLNQV